MQSEHSIALARTLQYTRGMDAPRILVPTDLSNCSKAALKYAAFVREQTGAHIHVLHVVEPMRYVTGPLSLDTPTGAGIPLEQYSRKLIAENLDEFLSGFDREGLRLSVEIEDGIAHDTVSRKSKDYDLLVMGTHGRTGFQHLVTGSVAGRTVRSAACPVLTVREDFLAQAAKLARILVPVDPGEWSKPALNAAMRLAELVSAEVEALYVWEPAPALFRDLTVWSGSDVTADEFANESQAMAREALEKFVKSVAGTGPTLRFETGIPAQAVVERATAGNFDLVVVGTHGRKGLARLFLGSVAEKVIRSCPVPVMTVQSETGD